MTDRHLLYAAALLRATAVGLVGVILGIFLAERGFAADQIGIVVSAGLLGAAAAALLVTVLGDRVGRRRTLATLAVLAAAGGAVAAIATSLTVIVAAAFVGMVNGMGRDRGASPILEQAILPATATDTDRTKAFAWYNVCQDVGHGLGALLAGAPAILQRLGHIAPVTAMRITVLGACALLLATAVLASGLSRAAEPTGERVRAKLSPQTRRILWKISSLFAIDSLAGGFLTSALVSLFLFERFDVSPLAVGALYFGARVANAGSHLGAAWLARRIGLVNTMVFTHIPSSLLLVTVALAPSFPVAAILFLLREGLVEMDVPTRQSYVMAVVGPGERTFASGVTQLVRLAAWAVAPVFAGWLMKDLSLATPLFIGAGMKIAYDLLLYVAFRRLRPPEESETAAGAGSN